MSQGQIWSPSIILNYGPEKDVKCQGESKIGKTKQTRRCQRDIGKPRRAANTTMLEGLAKREPDVTTKLELHQVAQNCACGTHGSQIEKIYESICALLEQTNPRKSPQSQPRRPAPPSLPLTPPPSRSPIRSQPPLTPSSTPPTPTQQRNTKLRKETRIAELEDALEASSATIRQLQRENREKDVRLAEALENNETLQRLTEIAGPALSEMWAIILHTMEGAKREKSEEEEEEEL
jgi:hypothetical protein